MNQILTDEEITLIIRECARGSAINRDGSTSHRIARAIEQAILNKLSEQNESVVFYLCEGCGHYYQTPVTSCDCMADLPLIVTTFFTRQSPSVPKGWTAIHLKTGNEYQVIGEAIDATNMHCNQLMQRGYGS